MGEARFGVPETTHIEGLPAAVVVGVQGQYGPWRTAAQGAPGAAVPAGHEGRGDTAGRGEVAPRVELSSMNTQRVDVVVHSESDGAPATAVPLGDAGDECGAAHGEAAPRIEGRAASQTVVVDNQVVDQSVEARADGAPRVAVPAGHGLHGHATGRGDVPAHVERGAATVVVSDHVQDLPVDPGLCVEGVDPIGAATAEGHELTGSRALRWAETLAGRAGGEHCGSHQRGNERKPHERRCQLLADRGHHRLHRTGFAHRTRGHSPRE